MHATTAGKLKLGVLGEIHALDVRMHTYHVSMVMGNETRTRRG